VDDVHGHGAAQGAVTTPMSGSLVGSGVGSGGPSAPGGGMLDAATSPTTQASDLMSRSEATELIQKSIAQIQEHLVSTMNAAMDGVHTEISEIKQQNEQLWEMVKDMRLHGLGQEQQQAPQQQQQPSPPPPDAENNDSSSNAANGNTFNN
jgi:hypothetical protein